MFKSEMKKTIEPSSHAFCFITILASLWTMTIAQDVVTHCVKMFTTMKFFDCPIVNVSDDRFILWRYQNQTGVEDMEIARCYFNESCSTIDDNTYAVTNRTPGKLASLAIKNVTSEHHGWTLRCHALDLRYDFYVTSESHLSVYEEPISFTCHYLRAGDGYLRIVCQVIRVAPLVECRIYDKKFNTSTTRYPGDYYYNVTCECDIKIDAKNVSITINVVLIDCPNFIISSTKIYTSVPKSSELFSLASSNYIISGSVAAVLIFLIILILIMWCRRWRHGDNGGSESTPSIRFLEYLQPDTTHELVSAQNTVTCFDEDSENWSVVTQTDDESPRYDRTSSEMEHLHEWNTFPFTTYSDERMDADDPSNGALYSITQLPNPHVRLSDRRAMENVENGRGRQETRQIITERFDMPSPWSSKISCCYNPTRCPETQPFLCQRNRENLKRFQEVPHNPRCHREFPISCARNFTNCTLHDQSGLFRNTCRHAENLHNCNNLIKAYRPQRSHYQAANLPTGHRSVAHCL